MLDELDANNAGLKDLALHDCFWEIGVSQKSASVAEAGQLRVIEFTNDLGKPTVDHVYATVIKAIANPNYREIPYPKHIPKNIILLDASILDAKQAPKLTKKLLAKGITMHIEKDVRADKELLAKWKAAGSQPRRTAQSGVPKKSCIKCSKDIDGKASQCSTCKAVIYCSPECAVSLYNLRS